jgi:cytidylate kinase
VSKANNRRASLNQFRAKQPRSARTSADGRNLFGQVFAANYKLYLPSEKEIVAEIKSEQEKLRLLMAEYEPTLNQPS